MKKIAILTLMMVCAAGFALAQDWKLADNPIYSPWAEKVSPTNALPEYPRPQFARAQWQSLNGMWNYAISSKDQNSIGSADGQILVPYPIESALSGVKKVVGPENVLVYSRTFQVPAEWKGQRILLHFEAVDWQAEVTVNGKIVGEHTGGYAPFCFDITDFLTDGEQTLFVKVYDPTDANWQPRGKQVRNPGGIWYTSVTGIWGSVWMEPVAKEGALKNASAFAAKFEGGKLVPTTDGSVVLQGNACAPDGAIVKAEIYTKDGASCAQATAPVKDGKFLATAKIENAKFWTPDSPYLYPVKYTLAVDGKCVDGVDSYLGMRTSTLGKTEDGITRMLLNGEFVFQYGPLDQGWWPDGLYTAPTDEALKFDIKVTKKMGMNMLRKHVKVEPRRFYYWCDVLGMMVWQDMPSGDRYIGGNDADHVRTPESAANYYHEWGEIMDTLRNSPSIVMWVPFNEGWGQFDTEKVVDWTKTNDPTRLVDCASGWTDRNCGDVHDMHSYPGPNRPEVEENRAIVLGEFGGLGLPCKGNAWQENGNWGYVSFNDKNALLARYTNLIMRLRALIDEGLSAAVYTQTTDVEVEVNGLFSYDRKVDKMGTENVAEVNKKLYEPAPIVKNVIPTSEKEGIVWSYTFDKPADGWMNTDFDASSWKTGEAGFGTKNTPNTTVRTEWNSSDIWVRRDFELTETEGTIFGLTMYHDEDAEVYINGVKAFEIAGYTTNYTVFNLPKSAQKAFRVGKNTLAIHCKQTMGGQYIDAGIVQIIPQDK